METADFLSIGSGGIVGFALGLLGSGGSIMAVPLLLYVVGVRSPHVAIGTGALAVSVSALAGLIPHSRANTVKWPCATVFALSGIAGAAAGTALGQLLDGGKLLFLFGIAMLAVAVAMLSPRAIGHGDPGVALDARIAPRLVAAGVLVGAMSGFFGIGGGFLIVPGLMLASGMAMLNAAASSLVSVAAFGLTTAMSYAIHGMVDWRVAGFFVAGGIAGGLAGTRLSARLGQGRNALRLVFAGTVVAAGLYVVWRSYTAFFG